MPKNKKKMPRITSKFAIIVFSILLLILSKPESLTGQEEIMKPVLAKENFDTCVTKISLKYTKNDKEDTVDIGTGFFVIGNDNFMYLVSAGHVFKKAIKFLLDNKGAIFIHQELTIESKEGKHINYYNIDLMDLWKNGLLQLNEEKDIGIVRLVPFQRQTEGKSEQKPENEGKPDKEEAKREEKRLIFQSINLLANDQIVKYGDIRKAEEVYFLGYPDIRGLKDLDKTHSLTPLIRRGIVSKKIDGQRIIIEGFCSGGSSGSPVFLRREFFGGQPNGLRIVIKNELMGVITTTFLVQQQAETSIETADLALVESVDSIIDTLNQFSIKKP
jgi:hypothetical protein